MFPYGSDPQSRPARAPWITLALLLLNVVVFGYQLSLGSDAVQEFVYNWGFIPDTFWSGDRIYTIVTSIFLHGGVLHIISNMIYLAIFGPNVEAALGRRTFILFYLLGGIFASLVYAIAFSGAEVPLVGASGAIAAVLGGYVLLFPRSMIRSFLFAGPFVTAGRVAAVILIGFWFLLQVFQSAVSVLELAPQQNIAFLAHAGGFVFGLIAVGAIREARDQQVVHWETSGERWFNRSFRNWLILVILFGLGLAYIQILNATGRDALAALSQVVLLGLAGLLAMVDGWMRLRGYRGLLGSTQRAEHAVAIIQLIAGFSILSTIFWT